MKEEDPKHINKSGLIDFDLLMAKILNLFRDTISKTKRCVINAFAACDLGNIIIKIVSIDNNGRCNLEEWLTLNRYLETSRYDEDKLITLFEEYADLIIEDERNLSFERFSLICLEN